MVKDRLLFSKLEKEMDTEQSQNRRDSEKESGQDNPKEEKDI
jgi:hypothetical protein